METAAARGARVGALRERIERRLAELTPVAQGPARRLGAAMGYALLAPGKRLRPLIVVLIAAELGADVDDVLDAACAVEMVHAASLVLDDLPCMDDAQQRRGQPATHVRHGEDMAVLASVALLNLAYAVIGGGDGAAAEARLDMVRALSAAIGVEGLVGGQERDLRDGCPSLSHLRDIHHRKTGVLFVASAALGGLAGGATVAERAALERFAAEFGLAFQARDDACDAIEDGAAPLAGRASIASLVGSDGALAEVERRCEAAKAALRGGGPRLAPLAAYVDLLLSAPAAAAASPAA